MELLIIFRAIHEISFRVKVCKIQKYFWYTLMYPYHFEDIYIVYMQREREREIKKKRSMQLISWKFFIQEVLFPLCFNEPNFRTTCTSEMSLLFTIAISTNTFLSFISINSLWWCNILCVIFRTVVLIFIVVGCNTTFQPLYPPAFLSCSLFILA